MLNREEILNLIDSGEYSDAFLALNKFFLNKDSKLNALIDEFVNPPGNFALATYLTRLKVFVNLNYKPPKAKNNPNIDYYDLLCALDFKLQTDNFERIYPFKNIVSFLLHCDSPEQVNDIKWLCKQLLYSQSLSSDFTIDLGSTVGGSCESLLKEFYIKFNINDSPSFKTKPIVQLRSKIEEKLQNGHLVCIIKRPESLLGDDAELDNFLTEFLGYLDEHIDKEKCDYALIFIFIDDKQKNFPKRSSEYFLIFDEKDEAGYFTSAIDSGNFRIIDLAPIRQVVEMDISKWIGHGMKKGIDVYSKISCYHGKEKHALGNGSNPYQVIEKICSDLNVPIKDTWKI